jgi:plasmid maintenance system antidote protein VapI
MDIGELLDKAKSRANLASDYALAKAIGITAGNLSNIRKGRTHPSNEQAVQIATLAGLDEMQVIAEIELRTANTPKKKEFWTHYIESRGLTACITLTALAVTIAITPEPASATVLQLQNYDATNTTINQEEYTLCVN